MGCVLLIHLQMDLFSPVYSEPLHSRCPKKGALCFTSATKYSTGRYRAINMERVGTGWPIHAHNKKSVRGFAKGAGCRATCAENGSKDQNRRKHPSTVEAPALENRKLLRGR
jgi:hypothetical protein